MQNASTNTKKIVVGIAALAAASITALGLKTGDDAASINPQALSARANPGDNLRAAEYRDANTGAYVCDATGGTAPQRKAAIDECKKAARKAMQHVPG